MGIKEVIVNGKKCFEVTVHIRSKIDRKIRSQRKRSGFTSVREAQVFEKQSNIECSLEGDELGACRAKIAR